MLYIKKYIVTHIDRKIFFPENCVCESKRNRETSRNMHQSFKAGFHWSVEEIYHYP